MNGVEKDWNFLVVFVPVVIILRMILHHLTQLYPAIFISFWNIQQVMMKYRNRKEFEILPILPGPIQLKQSFGLNSNLTGITNFLVTFRYCQIVEIASSDPEDL